MNQDQPNNNTWRICSMCSLAELEETVSQLSPWWVQTVVVMENFSWRELIKTVPLFIKVPWWSCSVQFLPVSDHHSTTSLLASSPAADEVFKGDEWALTLSGNRYPIVEEWVIVLGFHFALFPVDLFLWHQRRKISPGPHFIHTHTTFKHRRNFIGLHLKEIDQFNLA